MYVEKIGRTMSCGWEKEVKTIELFVRWRKIKQLYVEVAITKCTVARGGVYICIYIYIDT